MASAELLKSRTTSKKLFTRNINAVQNAIKMNDDYELVEKKLNELCKKFSVLQENHELYVCEVENEEHFDESKEENWMSEVESTFYATERIAHAYIKTIKDNVFTTGSLLNDSASSENQSTCERNKLSAMREFEKNELIREIESMKKIFINSDIDDSMRKGLLKQNHNNMKKQVERCKNAQAEYIACLPTSEVKEELKWTNEIHDLFTEVSIKLASHNIDDSNENKVCENKNANQRSYGLKLQPMPLPKFNGDIKEYPRFKDDFANQVVPAVSERQQPYVLKSCLSGVPLDIVKNVDNCISSMWERLDDKYGEPSKIIDVIMNDIKRLKPVKDNDNAKFVKLIDIVERSYRDLERLNLEQELSNAQSVSMIEDKLPLGMKMLWSEHVKCRMARTTNKFPELLKFLIERKSIIEYALSDLRTTESGASASVHFVDQDEATGAQEARNDNSQGGTFHCLIHKNAKHGTTDCDAFLNKSIDERIEIVKDNNACWSCLKIGHQSAWCWYRKKCPESECNMYHDILLHKDQTEGTALHANPSDLQNSVNSKSCLLQLMKIPTSNDQNVNVLWDGGATISLITFRKANELGLEGKHINLSVTKVGGKSEQINSNKYELTLKDKKGKNVNFIVYGIDKISSEVRDIDISSTLKLFKNVNLKDLQRPVGEIDILIGFEYAGFHPSRIQSNGHLLIMENQFGRCLSGSHSSVTEKTVKFVQHAVIHHAKGVNLETFFDVEGLGVTCSPKCGSCRCGKCAIGEKDFTIKEERELELIERGLIRHDDHWEASYPWLISPSTLEDNRCVASAMLKSTEKDY